MNLLCLVKKDNQYLLLFIKKRSLNWWAFFYLTEHNPDIHSIKQKTIF